jgi:hypothetical protein
MPNFDLSAHFTEYRRRGVRDGHESAGEALRRQAWCRICSN